jgi:NADH:ubiquinone oxidoreductase subunit 5 (subunit L)/multisubunit Na+/H+ antiporter MnhA subunit
MTAFYMFRLMAMTFFGGYRGPAWEHAAHGAVAVAAAHGVKHPADPHAHGQAHRQDHEVSHGPAHAPAHTAPDDHGGGGHGHGPWHGPHESPTRMTFPLMALAVGAIVAGFVGVPAASAAPITSSTSWSRVSSRPRRITSRPLRPITPWRRRRSMGKKPRRTRPAASSSG